MNLRWLVSKTVRTAGAMRKHVHKILCAQRDLLSGEAIAAVQGAINETKKSEAGNDEAALKKQMEKLEEAANKWLKPYPNAAIRENVEVLLVALAVALGIRTFFVQPFKIPTGSMQPTLNGVIYGSGLPVAAQFQPDLVIPGAVARFFDFWIYGDSYFNITAPEDGQLTAIKPPTHFLLFNLKQEYQFNQRWYTIWFPPDELFQRAGLSDGYRVSSQNYKAGQTILRMKVVAGDHLFVDRLSYNFRHPKRGEIIVFATHDIGNQYWTLPPDQFYIKRLVGLPGEKIQIGDDRHLIINGHRLDTNSDWPHFAKVYSFDPQKPPHESEYSGHVNGHWMAPQNAPLFPNQDSTVTVRPDHFMVMGDNTMNSLDSRVWGDFPETNVIGKYFFVYWPFSKRFGWTPQ